MRHYQSKRRTMARLKNPKASIRKTGPAERPARKRPTTNKTATPEAEHEDIEEIENRYHGVDEEDFLEEKDEAESEEEEHIASRSLTRRRHHDRNDVTRVGRIKQRSEGFSSNGHGRNERVSFRGPVGTRTTVLRRRLESREQESGTERTPRTRLNRRRVAAVETKAVSERNRAKSPASKQKYSGNGQASLRNTASRKSRTEKTQSPLRASRRRER